MIFFSWTYEQKTWIQAKTWKITSLSNKENALHTCHKRAEVILSGFCFKLKLYLLINALDIRTNSWMVTGCFFVSSVISRSNPPLQMYVVWRQKMVWQLFSVRLRDCYKLFIQVKFSSQKLSHRIQSTFHVSYSTLSRNCILVYPCLSVGPCWYWLRCCGGTWPCFCIYGGAHTCIGSGRNNFCK